MEKPFERKQMKIRFPERGRSGRSVVTIKNLEFGFEDKVRYQNLIIENLSIKCGLSLCHSYMISTDHAFLCQPLFKKANLSIERGEKIAIIGPNGCGKSSVLKLIMGLEKPTGGEVSLGEHNVLPNYFEQNQVCHFNRGKANC